MRGRPRRHRGDPAVADSLLDECYPRGDEQHEEAGDADAGLLEIPRCCIVRMTAPATMSRCILGDHQARASASHARRHGGVVHSARNIHAKLLA